MTFQWVRDIWLDVDEDLGVSISSFAVDLSLVQEDERHVLVVDVDWVIMVLHFTVFYFAVDEVIYDNWSWRSVVEGFRRSSTMLILVVEAVLFNLDLVGTST